MVKSCLICGKEFYIKPSHADKRKHCSRKCYYKSKLKEENVLHCDSCGKEFLKYTNSNRRIKYCSRNCAAMAKKLAAQELTFCKICNKELFFPKWRNKKYCGECFKEGVIKRPIKYCEVCNKEFNISPTGNITYFKKRRFCSQYCMGIAITRDKLGENSPYWKGNKIKNKSERSRFRNAILKEVLKRDNYECKICKSKNNLQVDHIQPWSKYKKLRFSMDNCRTVCARCHYKITFGYSMPEKIVAWGHHNLKRRNIL